MAQELTTTAKTRRPVVEETEHEEGVEEDVEAVTVRGYLKSLSGHCVRVDEATSALRAHNCSDASVSFTQFEFTSQFHLRANGLCVSLTGLSRLISLIKCYSQAVIQQYTDYICIKEGL